MEDLILYGKNRQKKQIIRNCIEFDCAVGRNAYSDNDFVLKTSFDKDELYEVGEWVSYGYTEYGGIIRSRTIDVDGNIVIYEGQTFRGILSTILAKGFAFHEAYEGTPQGIMNWIFANRLWNTQGTPLALIYTANGTDDTVTTVGGFSTSGLPFTNFLYLHDNITRTFSTVENKPIKSRFSFRNGVITIDFVDGKTFYFDSDKVRLKYAENKNTPNVCYCMTRKAKDQDGFWEYKEGVAYLTADGDASESPEDWVANEQEGTAEICLVAESSGEATDGEDVDNTLYLEAKDRLLEAQEKPSTEIEIDTEEAEVDDVIIASISELKMKVTKKVVESRLKISNGIPKITYTLEG